MSGTVIALSTALILVLLLCSAGGLAFYFRLHKGSKSGEAGEEGDFSPTRSGARRRMVPPTHPASQISPFGNSAGRPIFNHEPGQNMRVAYRREDGGWEFFDSGLLEDGTLAPPRSAMTPEPYSPISETSRAPSSMGMTPLPTAATTRSNKAYEAGLHTVNGTIAPPPPAYSRDDTSSVVSSPLA